MKTLAETIAELPAGEQHAIRARDAELVAEELTLRQLREILGVTQEELADRLEIGQDNISRFERREDVRLSTLRGYVEALGGELHVTAHFPNRAPVTLTGPAAPGPGPRAARG